MVNTPKKIIAKTISKLHATNKSVGIPFAFPNPFSNSYIEVGTTTPGVIAATKKPSAKLRCIGILKIFDAIDAVQAASTT